MTLQSPITAKDKIAALFEQLCAQWKADERPTSLVVHRIMHPAYQRIIGLGARAVPMILAELERETDDWFWALEAITGENPIPESDYGKMQKMADAWLNWGHKNGSPSP